MEFEPFVGLSLVIGIINLFIVLGCLVNACSCSNELKICRRQLNWLEHNVLTKGQMDKMVDELESNHRTVLRGFRHLEEVVLDSSLTGIAQELKERRERGSQEKAELARPTEKLSEFVERLKRAH